MTEPGDSAATPAAQVFLRPAAVQNWAQITGGPADRFAARQALLDAIDQHGQITSDPPAWMTSPKPSTDAYVHLPDGVTLLLRNQPDPELLPYEAVNCVAPRRRPNRNQRTSDTLEDPALEGADLDAAVQMTGRQLAEATRISVHACQRFAGRAGAVGDEDTLRAQLTELVATSGRVVAPPPAWADAAGDNRPVILIDADAPGDQWALVLTADRSDAPTRYVAVTFLSEQWVHSTFTGVPTPLLADRITVTKKAARQYANITGQDPHVTLNLHIRLYGIPRLGTPPGGERPCPHIVLPGGWLTVRPAAGSAEWAAVEYTAC